MCTYLGHWLLGEEHQSTELVLIGSFLVHSIPLLLDHEPLNREMRVCFDLWSILRQMDCWIQTHCVRNWDGRRGRIHILFGSFSLIASLEESLSHHHLHTQSKSPVNVSCWPLSSTQTQMMFQVQVEESHTIDPLQLIDL